MLDNIYKMVAENLVSNDEKGPQGETDSPSRYAVEKAYRNSHRWREDPRVNVSISIMGLKIMTKIAFIFDQGQNKNKHC